jgi:hypothetical protein
MGSIITKNWLRFSYIRFYIWAIPLSSPAPVDGRIILSYQSGYKVACVPHSSYGCRKSSIDLTELNLRHDSQGS